MNFCPDSRMQSYVGCETYESFLNTMVPEIWFRPEVHEDITKNFRVIKKLIEHSFYEYEFYDMAATKALLTLEMALKLRFQELTGEIWNRKTKKGEPKRDLNNLIKWFNDGSYFEIRNMDYLNHIRWMRNYFSHPECFTFGGSIMRHWIEHPMDLINDIYENLQLRKNRFSEQEYISGKLQELIRKGANLRSNDKEEIVYSASVLFIDNKEPRPVYYFSFIPTDIDHGDNSIRKQFIPAATTAFQFNNTNSELLLQDIYTGSKFSLTSICDIEHEKIYQSFSHELETKFHFISYLSWLNSGSARCFHNLRRDFHKK